LIYGPPDWRQEFITRIFVVLGFPAPRSTTLWLWRRIPHPEKPTSTGGPEIDFGMQSEASVVLGEAKWNSRLGTGQGVAGDRTQLDLRIAYCGSLGRKALPGIRYWGILGVGREKDVLTDSRNCDIAIRNASWAEVVELMPSVLRAEPAKYVAWKDRHSSVRPDSRLQPRAAN
jgi:hypothetical protein